MKPSPALLLPLGALFLTSLQLVSAARADDSVEITFDKNPIERGLSFDRTGVRATTVKFGDVESPAWVADRSIEPTMGWTRSFRFKITDPKFQMGNRPSVDVEITYHQSAGPGLSLQADTKTGGRQVGNLRGGTTNWRTQTLRVDNAFFGARDPKSDQKMSVDGFDLRLDGQGDALFLKSIKITGYDPKENVDWARMLKTGGIQNDRAGGIFVFPRAPRHEIRVDVQNMAKVARPLFYKFDVTGYDDKNRHTSSGALALSPDSNQLLPLAFNTSAWPLGPYDGKLSLFLNQGDATPIHTRTMRFGVVSDTTLPKAREGEFLYGLEAANTYIYDTHGENGMAFYRVMGADILRNLHRKGDAHDDPEKIGQSLARLARENMRAMLMFDPPKDSDAARRDAETARKAAQLEQIARLYAGRGVGQIRFFELGNEPDLRGFYPGTMSEYVRSFEAMRAGIKRGAAAKGLQPEDTVVMNGGLSFAGKEGDERSREFFKVVDASAVQDAVAYHGHGKGAESERALLNRARQAAIDAGKPGLKFIETESGFSSNERSGLVEQARTTVEKLAFAQSQGMETLIFFRLFMEGSGTEGGYGMTDNRSEPRPSVMAYRNMVERLRGHRFVKDVNFAQAMGAPGINAHLFEERDAQGAATGRKTLMAWSEAPAQYAVSLRLDARGGQVWDAQNFDLWGNPTPTPTVAGNIANIPIGIDPIYVSWQGGGASSLVDVAPALLTVNVAEPLLVGATTRYPVLARNPDARAQNAQIQAKAFGRVPVRASVSPAQIALRADGEPTSSQIALTLEAFDAPLALPTWWKVFTDIDAAKITPEILNSLPETVAGAQNPVAGKWVSSQSFAGGQRLEIAKIAGGFGEKRAALAVTTIDAPRDMTLPVAASADWYMQWNVNGREVYNTLEAGNRGGGLADHLFNLPLKKGQNVISALVLSGSGGWKLEFGGPKERALAQSGGTDPDRVEISLVTNGKVVSTQVVPLQIEAPIPSVGAALPQNPAQWMPLQPLAQLGEAQITNFFVKEPDQSRWYRGEKDLSALVWLRESGANLHLAVAVTDDQLVEAKTVAQLAAHDNLRALVRDENGKPLVDVTAGLVASQAQSSGTRGVFAQIVREGDRTFYTLTMPKTLVGSAPFRLSLAIGDNDSNFLKQKLDLSEGAGLRLIAR